VSEAHKDDKAIKRDQVGPRAAQDELLEEIEPGATRPRVEDFNRDRTRGDWDRTGDHHDEDVADQ
jgi:hypothetical protein